MNSTSNTVLAEEFHNSALWAFVLTAPAIGMIVHSLRMNVLGIQIVLDVTALVIFLSAVLAWSGFRYLFTVNGVEIRALGFRLRFIPVDEIRGYQIAKWSIAGGYGIRLRGNRSAYVWGNKGVRIKTSDGEVFLGSNRPEKIIQDLELITPVLS